MGDCFLYHFRYMSTGRGKSELQRTGCHGITVGLWFKSQRTESATENIPPSPFCFAFAKQNSGGKGEMVG